MEEEIRVECLALDREGDEMKRWRTTKREERMTRSEILKLVRNPFVVRNPGYHTNSVLLDILNYERLTAADFVLLGRNEDGTL
ncbi:MAG: hypothetical protein ABIL06_13190 [Pseudomonadota bacterium]|uniref:Uncharacterized protein n=1 Tax=viral metagenome TaxID=1070528 RepID=A0A6H1ZHK8_9ZZZZ